MLWWRDAPRHLVSWHHVHCQISYLKKISLMVCYNIRQKVSLSVTFCSSKLAMLVFSIFFPNRIIHSLFKTIGLKTDFNYPNSGVTGVTGVITGVTGVTHIDFSIRSPLAACTTTHDSRKPDGAGLNSWRNKTSTVIYLFTFSWLCQLGSARPCCAHNMESYEKLSTLIIRRNGNPSTNKHQNWSVLSILFRRCL